MGFRRLFGYQGGAVLALRHGLRQLGPVSCTQVDSRTIHLSATQNNSSVPLRFTNTGVFSNRGELGTILSGTKIHVQRICSELGYNHFSAKLLMIEHGQGTMVELNAEMNSFLTPNDNDESLSSINCAIRGKFRDH